MQKILMSFLVLLVSGAVHAADELPGCDGSDLEAYSQKHQAYLAYKSKFETAWQNYMLARPTQFRDAALAVVVKVEQEWEQFGYRNEIESTPAAEVCAEQI